MDGFGEGTENEAARNEAPTRLGHVLEGHIRGHRGTLTRIRQLLLRLLLALVVVYHRIDIDLLAVVVALWWLGRRMVGVHVGRDWPA
jgi:hypothetical protein